VPAGFEVLEVSAVLLLLQGHSITDEEVIASRPVQDGDTYSDAQAGITDLYPQCEAAQSSCPILVYHHEDVPYFTLSLCS
jgi:hypothetical protein